MATPVTYFNRTDDGSRKRTQGYSSFTAARRASSSPYAVPPTRRANFKVPEIPRRSTSHASESQIGSNNNPTYSKAASRNRTPTFLGASRRPCQTRIPQNVVIPPSPFFTDTPNADPLQLGPNPLLHLNGLLNDDNLLDPNTLALRTCNDDFPGNFYQAFKTFPFKEYNEEVHSNAKTDLKFAMSILIDKEKAARLEIDKKSDENNQLRLELAKMNEENIKKNNETLKQLEEIVSLKAYKKKMEVDWEQLKESEQYFLKEYSSLKVQIISEISALKEDVKMSNVETQKWKNDFDRVDLAHTLLREGYTALEKENSHLTAVVNLNQDIQARSEGFMKLVENCREAHEQYKLQEKKNAEKIASQKKKDEESVATQGEKDATQGEKN